MDLRKVLLNNATLQSRPRRRRHSIADVRFLHTLYDIPEIPDEEETEKERRRCSTGSFAEEKVNKREENSRCCKRSPSVEEEHLKKAVSTYVISYTDDAGNVIDADEVSPLPTGSSFPQESFKETSDEELALLEMLWKVETQPPMTTSRSRRNSIIDPVVMERITCLTPIVESSRSSSCGSVVANPNDFETSPDHSDQNRGSDHGSNHLSPTPQNADNKEELLGRILVSLRLTRRGSLSDVLNTLSPQFDITADGWSDHGSNHSSPKNADNKEELLGRILVSPRLTRRGSLSDVLNSLSPQLEITDDPVRQNIKKGPNYQIPNEEELKTKVEETEKLIKHQGTSNDGIIKSTHLSSQMHDQIKDPWRLLSPLYINTKHNEHLKQQEINDSSRKENGNVLGRIMNSPTLLKRKVSLGDVLRSLLPNVSCLQSKGVDTENSLLCAVDKQTEGDNPNKDKEDLIGRIIKSPCLTRRGSIGDVLNTLSPNRNRRSPSPSHFTTKSNAEDDSSNSMPLVCSGMPKPKDVKKSSGTSGPKGLLAIVQKHVMNHTQTLQRKRRNSIASTTPHMGSLDMSLRDTLDTEEWGFENKSVTECKSSVAKTTVPASTKHSLSSSTINSKQGESLTFSSRKDIACSRDASQLKDDSVNTPKPSDDCKSRKEKSQIRDDVVSRMSTGRLVGSDSMDIPRVQSDLPSVKPSQRKVIAPLPPRSVASPQRKISITIIKRSPVTFVISNNKDGKTEVRRNGSEYQVPSGVSLMNSRFVPLSQKEAEEYSMIKKEEASKLSSNTAVNSTITMSSRVTVHGRNGRIVRKLGISAKQSPLKDTLPTDERFAALSERYASLKAKIGGNDAKQKNQDSSPKSVESKDRSPNTKEKLIQSKCWTTVESIPIEELKGNVSSKLVDELCTEAERTLNDDGNQKGNSQENDIDNKRVGITRSDDNAVKRNDTTTMKTVISVHGMESDAKIDENNNNSSSISNKPRIAEIVEKKVEIRTNEKTVLDLRPESPAQRTRTSVVAKLMNRKMGSTSEQSIVPRVAKRRSKVYKENCSADSGIPASAAQFEEIRTLVENTMLRAPVRQEALTIQELLNGLCSCLMEAELVAICKECSKTLRTLDALGSLPSYVSLESVIINPSGTIKFMHLSTGISIDDLFLAPEYSNRFASEKTCVFGLAATLWSAADWRLTEAEKPSLSPRLQELLVSMTDDGPDARPGLNDVLQTCESLQTEGDMTSRERCQALLWEYQASAVMENEDAAKRKTVEEEKKHYDTLMGSISVAASFKGFLKQTAKPQERNPFIKTQKNQEQLNKIDNKPGEKLSTKRTVLKSEEVKTKKDTIVGNSQELKDTSNSRAKASKEKPELPSSGSTNDTSASASDVNNNRDATQERTTRGCTLTEDQKEQLLSLLATSKLNKNSFVTTNNGRKSKEASKQTIEEYPNKPPSPSMYVYPQYGQTEARMMFSPITPAGRPVSPSVHSDMSDSQIPAVPNFVPIAVPIPSVTSVPMPPFWYMPQGGMMPYPQPAMAPVQYAPVDPSMASNRSVASDSDLSEVSDLDPRSKNSGSSSNKERTRQSNKGSRLPRPIWQTPVTRSRATPVESEASPNVVRRRTPISDEFNKRNEEIKRTPSPSLGGLASSKATTPPRSRTPPVYWTRDGVDMPANNQQKKRQSMGSLPNSRPSSPSSSTDGQRRSRSRPNSPVQKPSSRPSSPAGSRSNSPVSILVSKFEEMSQDTSGNPPRGGSNSVSSMISKFGSSSLVPEDRIVKGQFKPNPSASAPQPASKTGPFRSSMTCDRTQDHSPSVNPMSSRGNPISSRENPISSHDRSRTNVPSEDDKRLVNSNLADPREVNRSGSNPGSGENKSERLFGEYLNQLSSSLENILKKCESSDDRYQDSRTNVLENVSKWSSQENIMRDSGLGNPTKSVQERCKSEHSLIEDYSTKKETLDDTISTNARRSSGKSSSSDDMKPSNALDEVSKPWWTKEGFSTEPPRKSSLDSEPVREKGSAKSRPRDICVTPERDSSMQYCDITSPKDFLWSPTSDTHKFEIPVDLAVLESTTPTVSSGQGSMFSSTAPLSPGSLKDFKPSSYFTNVTFKYGEMEPERDTNCLTKTPTPDSIGVSSDTVSNSRDPNHNYVRRFERKILRSTGDVENELFLSHSGSDDDQSVTSSDANTVDSNNKRPYSETGIPKKEVKDNPLPVTSTQPKISPNRSENPEFLAAIAATRDSTHARTHSKNDPIVGSRHSSGDGQSVKDRAPLSTSRKTPLPMPLRKLLSNPLPREENASPATPSRSKRNSLPTSQPSKLSPNRDPYALLSITKSSSQTNLSSNQKQIHKSSSQANLTARQRVEGFSSSSRKAPALNHGKDDVFIASDNAHSKRDEIQSKCSAIIAELGNPSNHHPSKERQVPKEHSKERNPHSSSPHVQATKTKSANATSGTSRNSEPRIVRYPYTRRGSTPVKGSSAVKPPPKAASSPTSPLYPKHQKGFFGASSANYHSNPQGSMNSGDPNSAEQVSFKSRRAQHNPNPRQQTPSSEGSSARSSGVGSSPMASPSTTTQFLEQLRFTGELGDPDVFYETFGKPASTKATTKRFSSSSSSDSGLTMSDPDETRKGNGNGSKSNRVWSPPTSLSSSPSPTSPKFPIGNNIFHDPRDQQPTLLLSERESEPPNLTNSFSASQQNEASNPLKNSSIKSSDSTNKTARSDSDKYKNFKGGVSKMQDKISLDANERINNLPEKPKDATAALKAVALAQIAKSTSKERSASSTPPPDILGRPSSKSPPSSSRVDSKELLGQLVKKVLNSAAAKQGSSPKTSFAESASSSPRDSDKGKRAAQGKMFLLPEEMIGEEDREKSNRPGQNQKTDSLKDAQIMFDAGKAAREMEQRLIDSKEIAQARNREDASTQSLLVSSNAAPVKPSSASKVESSLPEEQLAEPKEKDALSKIIDLIHDEFAFDGYLDDGVEDVNMAEYVLSLAGMSEENFKEAITDQYSDLYWDEDLLREMYEAVTAGQQQNRRTTLQFSESTLSDISPPESINLSRGESYLSLEPLYFNISRSSSERSGTGARDVLVSPLGEATEFLPIKVIAPEMQADIHELLTPIFEDYHRVMGIKLASSVEDLSDKLGTKIMEISQQLMLERRAKKKSMNSYNKMADVDNKKDVKDLASKLVNEIEESDKKIIYLKQVQRQLRNVYAERFGVDTSLLYAFLVSYNTSCVTLEPELNNSFLNFSPIWKKRVSENTDIVDESSVGPSLQTGTKLGLFSYLFDRHAMSQAYVRYFLYTFRYIVTPQELFTFIREKCSASLRTDASGQVYNHQLQIRYRALDLLSEWIDGYYQFDFKTNPNLINELLAFVKDELILVDRSERGHYLMELITEKQKKDLNNNSLTEEFTDFVAVLQLEDPQGLSPIEGKRDSLKKPLSGRKSKSPVQCFRRATPEKETTYKATLYLKALSVLDHSSRIIAEQLTLIQQDLFLRIHPLHFLNSRAHGIGVGRNQTPTRERDSIFGFTTGSRRVSELPGSEQAPLPWEHNMYVSEPSSDGALEDLLEHAQDVSLWVAVEICSTSSIKAQLALITKFVNAARYCCEIRNYSTCIQIIDALEMFVVRHLPVWKQVPTKTVEVLEEMKAVKVLLKTDSSWLMKSESSRDKPTIPCFVLFVIHVQQQELGGFTLPSDMYKWTKMRSVARLVDQLRLFKQMRYAFQTDEDLKARLKQRIHECKNENLHALASENTSNFHLSSSHGSRKFHDAFKKMKATLGGHNS